MLRIPAVLLPLTLGALAACRGIEPLEAPPALEGTERARAQVGQRLFFDPLLSLDEATPCSSCHAPEAGGADPRPTSVGVGGAVGRRNAPSVFNAALKFRQFWDGRTESLEAQPLGPLFAVEEMGLTPAELVERLTADARYPEALAAAFPDDPTPVRAENVARALAAYLRQLAWPGRVDRFLAGDGDALSALERRGYDDFSANCAFCHDGVGVGGQRFERLGEARPWPVRPGDDLGREEMTGQVGDRLIFVVPSLRHVADTAPYFHDGSVATLEEAIRLMGRHQLDEELSDDRVEAIAAFLRALDGDIPAALLSASPP